MASSDNGINVDDRREHGDPTGTGGAFTDLEAEGKSFTQNQALHGLKQGIVFD